MKARLLRKLLNDTRYTVSNHENYIAVGSPMCHNLISLDKSTLKITYALDTWRKGRESVIDRDNEELLFIWDKLQELVDNGEIHEIINGSDLIENPLPVYTVKNGELIESVTDHYGWPNTTDDGYTMYENTHFHTKKLAIEYGIREYTAGLEMMDDRKKEAEEKLAEVTSRIDKYTKYLEHLHSLQKISHK